MGIEIKKNQMKIIQILTITIGANAWSFGRWENDEYVLPTVGDYDCNRDYCAYGDVTTTASTNTEELTTTLEPESMLTTTTDGEYTPPDIKTTTMTSTELTSATNTADVGDDVLVGDWWSAAWSSLPCYITQLTIECASTEVPSTP